MISCGTCLSVKDNSGGKTGICIKVLGGSGRKVARVGDEIVVSIKSLRSRTSSSRTRVTSGMVHRAIVLRTRKEHRRPDGLSIGFSENAVLLLSPKSQPLGTRLFGPILEDLRRLRGLKITSLSSSLV